MVRRALVLTLLSLAVPSAASAATVTVESGVLRYVAAPDFQNNVTFSQTGSSVTVTRVGDDADELTDGAGCTSVTSTAITCSGITRVEADAGNRADRLTSTLTTITTVLEGGDGDDALDGGPSADILRGEDGNDILTPNTGTDSISGGDGLDTVVYGRRVAPVFTFDALANDGDAGENDLIGNDVENLSAASESGLVTIVGDGRANQLSVVEGRGDITGGDGADILLGGPLDDILRARDGAPDTIICRGGIDTVEADTLDTVSTTCENVSIQAVPGGAFDDKAPLIAWAAPGAGAALDANTPSILRVEASDDRGLAKVQFLDDDRVVCEDMVAPYECMYQPRGSDVGRNTLIAIAVDGANQTTSIVRPVTVKRFTSPGVSLKVRPSRDRRAPYSFRATGSVRRPETVAPSQGCTGRVIITAKKGSKTVGTTRVSLTRTCDYAVTVKFRTKVGSRIRLTAKFEGNDVLASRSAPSKTVRLG
jgi:hypothetical protein